VLGEMSVLGEVTRAFAEAGVDLERWGLAWARAMPTVALVPAFGLRAMPTPARGVMGMVLALSIFPAVAPPSGPAAALPWVALAGVEIVRGLPIAIAAAVPLWAATMAGGTIDALRGANDAVQAPVIEGRTTTLGAPLSLLASFLFLAQGGPARVALALATRPPAAHPALAVAHDLSTGIGLAIAVAAPLLAASVVLEVAGALVARAASPAQVHAVYSPLRSLGVLCIFALVFDRLAGVLARAMP